MKNAIRISKVILSVLSIFLFNSCELINDSSSLKDFDGNVYKTVTIGTQVWMAENLKTTKYKDGTAIPLVKVASAWANLQTPGYCWYLNDSVTYKNVIGGYYNWFTVNTGKLCPSGWHVPTKDEWITLANYLGGFSIAGGKLKEKGYDHWLIPNEGATNESGFTAYANGIINDVGNFYPPYVERSLLWSSTEYDNSDAWHFQLNWSNTNFDLGSQYFKKSGLGVRCLQD